jgi:pyruvyltransferase
MNARHPTTVWKLAKEKLLDPLRRVAFETVYHGYLPLYYCDSPNWGDALSPVLCGLLSGRPVKKMLWHHQHRYLAIGSILGNSNRRAEVWGGGFIWPDEKLAEPPEAVHAVRGPRTRARLLAQGIDCPEIYGDPALLFPRFFNPPVTQTYAVGIIPHFSDKESDWVKQQQSNPDPQVRIIDVEGGIEPFVEAVKSCELIVSSSLHGLICADAYGVPNLWVKLSDILWGGSFKFCDYFESVGRETPVPVIPDAATSLAEVTRCHRPYEVRINLRPLITVCPFMADDVRRKLLDTNES